ncbi:MAG TPA: ankyrin repeat domain-containing protein [Verrucomicrobiae bacterium]|nr:ankyrin repeat domain-containing protein [Verrucomicrobiae bacterium]
MKSKFVALIHGLFLLVLTPGCWLTGSDTYDVTKYTAAHQAALDGDDAALAPLLKSNPHLISVPDYDKNTLLHLAVMHDRTNTVSLLLDSKAEVDAKNSVGMTPLHLAAREGFFVVAKILVEHHADRKITDQRGWTALKWAEMSHHEDLAALLRENGASN